MKKANFTKWLLLPVLLLMGVVYASAQTIACNDNVQVSVDPATDGTCTVDLTADMVLEGDPDPNVNYQLDVMQGVNVLFTGINVVSFSAHDYLNQTLTVKVTDLSSGNSCWSSILIEDKAAPEVICNTVTIACTEDYNNVPFPPAYDNCDLAPDVQMFDQYFVDTDVCDDNQVVVMRGFIAIDDQGNESAGCYQSIIIQRPTDVDFPNDIMWECDQYSDYPAIVDATPVHPTVAALEVVGQITDATGIADASVLANTGSGIPLAIDGEFCNYGYSYSDQTIETCGNTFKIVRTWTVLDWCTGATVTSNNQGEDNIQIIKVVDITAPVVYMDPFTVSANVPAAHPQPCKSTGYLPAPQVTDNCHSYTIGIFTPVGEAVYVNGTDGAQGGFIPAPGLELGYHEILYQAIDECGNVGEYFVTIEVVDDIAPTAICLEITDVNLSSEGEAVVPADVFDNGTHDNCCLDHFEARRMDGDCDGNYDDFGPDVTFCCSDAGQSVMVVFRAYDCFGNYNDCMVTVNVQDKIPPVNTYCPDDVQITCDDYLQNLAAALELGDGSVLDQYGEATFYDNCDPIVDYQWSYSINTCTEGTITRTWTATDASDNTQATCTQTIYVNHVDDWYVVFPNDIIAQCVDGTLPDFGEPQIFDDECELIGVSYQDDTYYVVPDVCYKIVRHWSVINWCTYPDGLSYTHDQVIKVVDEEAPIFDVTDQTYCIEETDCDVSITLPTPDVTDCSTDITITVTSDDLAAYATGDQYSYSNVPPGEYVVNYEVEDGCGNHSYDEIVVTVVDCKKPTPYCVEGLVIEIMQTGMIDIWASDFDAGSFDNCPGDLKLSLSPDVNDTQRIYTCDDLGQQPIELWVTDASGNQDFCATFVEIQDNMGVCPGAGAPLVAGAIANEVDVPVEGVDVELSGSGNNSAVTDANGEYSFTVPMSGGDYTITPSLLTDADNGVTTIDVVLITRHILEVEPLDSPYKMIAADANNSGSITTLDVVAIRKVILLQEEGFPDNTSWRFVDASFVFPDPTDPFSSGFPEVINYNNVTEDILFADFVAIKVGDVNNSAQTNADGAAVEMHNAETFVLHTADKQVQAGEEVAVSFSADQLDVLGYQFTLNFDKEALELVEVQNGVTTEENFGLSLLNEGAITVSWNGEAKDATQFTLVFKARQNTSLSEALSISSRYTKAEAYDQNGALMNVALAFNGTVATNGFELYQNTPNPFANETTIGFNLPEAGEVSLKVYNLSGKVVLLKKVSAEKGYNEITLNAQTLGATGVLYYTLETADETATRKMIIME